ncbi:nucleotide pyrophosphohydrolase [Saccharopolyspora indica]|uniref:nucleotide pyrophosphohydrolase n=1 Tax=Saccharopolyspora indica TaxID=1229659 RepID=UPI0022EA3CD1|nr:nucleotide pyrophosphohydrolase [Saccharopolyspora indica]MDA3647439.1 nucleotide pyrophosphohydrolase [Saccharopolyspora indica]
MDSVDGIRDRLRDFAAARDWEQYHTPKNLAMALSGEAGELAAELQWLDGAPGPVAGPLKERLADEAADVLIYLIRLADVAGIDLVDAANAKIDRNETRFPPTGS